MIGPLVAIAGTVAAMATLYLWGRAILSLLRAGREGLDVVGCVLAGLLALTLTIVATVAAGVRPSAIAVGVAMILTVALAARLRGAAATPNASGTLLRLREAARDREGRTALALAVVTAAVLLAMLLYARQARIAWDGVALWTLKARALEATASFRDHYLAMHGDPQSSLHLDYPLAVPSLTWWLARFHVGTVPVAAAVAGVLWLAALPVLAAEGLRRPVGAVPAALAGLAMVVQPVQRYGAYGGMADLPLAACVLATVVELLRGDEAGRRRAALFVALAASTKVEGLVLAIALLLATGVASLASRSRGRLAWACLPLATMLPWQLLLRSRGVAMRGAEGGAQAASLLDLATIAFAERAPVLLRGAAQMVLTPTFLPAVLLFGGGALVFLRRARGEGIDVLVPWMTATLYVLGLGASYLLLVDEPIQWLVDTSLLRLIGAVLPALAVLGLHGLLADPRAWPRHDEPADARAGRAARRAGTRRESLSQS